MRGKENPLANPFESEPSAEPLIDLMRAGLRVLQELPAAARERRIGPHSGGSSPIGCRRRYKSSAKPSGEGHSKLGLVAPCTLRNVSHDNQKAWPVLFGKLSHRLHDAIVDPHWPLA